MLFLNKKDIYLLKRLCIVIFTAQRPFCDYAGPTKDFDHGVLYFIQKFKDCLILVRRIRIIWNLYLSRLGRLL